MSSLSTPREGLLHVVPHLFLGIELSPFDSSSNKSTLLTSESGRNWAIAPALVEIIRAIDGHRNTQQIIEVIAPHRSLAIELRLIEIIWNDLVDMGIVVGCDEVGLQYSSKQESASRSALSLRIPLFPPRCVLAISKVFQYLYIPAIAWVLVVFAISTQIYWGIHSTWPSTYATRIAGGRWLAVLLLVGIAYLFHEFGHTSACTRFGGKCGAIGFGIYWVYPVFFADVTGAWKLPRMQRAIVDLGGIYFQCLCVSLLIIWNYLKPSYAVSMAIFISNASLLPNLYPFLKMDGYWFLSDITGIPNLMSILENLIRFDLSGIRCYRARLQSIIYGYCLLTSVFISNIAIALFIGFIS